MIKGTIIYFIRLIACVLGLVYLIMLFILMGFKALGLGIINMLKNN